MKLNPKIINLGHIVDTLKINASFDNSAYEIKPEYQSPKLEEQIKDFDSKIDELVKLKKVAMEIKAHDAQMRFVPVILDNTEYRVMASASAAYSVILQNGDISIFLKKFSKKVKNPVIKVEFRAEYLARSGYLKAVNQVKRLLQHEFIENPIYKIKEIHLACDVQGYEFTPLDFYRIRTLSKNRTIFTEDEKNQYFSNQRFTGMTFGKGDLMMRIYNKTVEINKNKKKGFISALKWQHQEEFNPDLNVWRIEGQIRRDKLKELAIGDFNLDNLDSVLNNIPSIWKLFVDRFVHKDITNEQIHQQIQGYKELKKGGIKFITADTVRMRFKNADVSNVWQSIQTYNGYEGADLSKFEDIKAPEVEYVENAYKALMSTTTKLLRGNFNTTKLVDIIHNANMKYFDKHGISIMEKCRLNALDYLSSAKYYYERHNFAFDGFDEYENDLISNLKELMDISTIHDKYQF